MDLKQFWGQLYAVAHSGDPTKSGGPVEFLQGQPDLVLRAAMMEKDNPFDPHALEPLVNFIAYELLNRQGVGVEDQIANLFVVVVSHCGRKLREKALQQLFVLDSREKVDELTITIALQYLPTSCRWSERFSNLPR